MAKASVTEPVNAVDALVQALGNYLAQPLPAEPTIQDKVALLHANDLYALLKPETKQDA